MSGEIFYVMPTNEGQELNYMETHGEGVEAAKKRAKELADKLSDVMVSGFIGCMVQDQGGNRVAFYDAETGEWE